MTKLKIINNFIILIHSKMWEDEQCCDYIKNITLFSFINKIII
jgi:hypothetical protein